MAGVVRSELIRLQRKGMLLAWLGLTAMFAVLINIVMFEFVAGADGEAADGPGTAFPSLEQLTSAEGLVSGMAAAGSFFGVVTLSFWAIAAATDYDSGLIRLLVAAEPRRWRLLAGKVVALLAWTAVAATLALIITVLVAPIGADAAGVSTDAWQQDAAGNLVRAWIDSFLALTVWGTIGLTLDIGFRSSAIAIAAGVGYVLVVEAVIEAALGDASHWLPGNTLTALAQGGTDVVSYAAALVIGGVYCLGGLAVAAAVVIRRDVTE